MGIVTGSCGKMLAGDRGRMGASGFFAQAGQEVLVQNSNVLRVQEASGHEEASQNGW